MPDMRDSSGRVSSGAIIRRIFQRIMSGKKRILKMVFIVEGTENGWVE
jgi:hypothetical protein